MDNMITLIYRDSGWTQILVRCRPDEYVDNVLVPLKNQRRRHWVVIKVVESASNQRETPTAAKSFTGGAKSSFPLNHGLTVC